ncbi:MAG: hypothetical protein WD423_10280 [Rhodothermales bacterium]
MKYTAYILTVLIAVGGLFVTRAATAQDAFQPQFFRPYDQSGINVFEDPKADTVAFEGFNVRWGAAFTQQFQGLDHSNEADDVIVDGLNVNALPDMGWGFNTATANLNLDAQLADGIRVNLITYLSSRHHSEAWVKGGYLSINKLPMLNNAALDDLMEFVTLRVGHFEINYGDAHFRRTDNGNAMYNPFVGNLIMDSFTTEIGGEVYVRSNGLMTMGAITNGEIKGAVLNPDSRAPAFYGKLGFDRELSEDLRVRLTGSAYTTAKSANNTLFSGDRAGSRYYEVMGEGFTSGRVQPGFRSEVTSFQINPFVKIRGLELFGVIETTSGANAGESDTRTWNQFAAEAIYRFAPREQLFVGARYNTLSGELAGSGTEVSIDRIQVGGGWFVTSRVLMKLEYVMQNYNDYPSTNALHEGEFNGIVIEGVVAF